MAAIYLLFILLFRPCISNSMEDESVVSVYTTQASISGTHKSLDVYHEIANNIAERITSPIYKFLGINQNKTDVKTSKKINWKKVELLDESGEIMPKQNHHPKTTGLHKQKDVEDISSTNFNKKQVKPEKITLYSSYLPVEEIKTPEENPNDDKEYLDKESFNFKEFSRFFDIFKTDTTMHSDLLEDTYLSINGEKEDFKETSTHNPTESQVNDDVEGLAVNDSNERGNKDQKSFNFNDFVQIFKNTDIITKLQQIAKDNNIFQYVTQKENKQNSSVDDISGEEEFTLEKVANVDGTETATETNLPDIHQESNNSGVKDISEVSLINSDFVKLDSIYEETDTSTVKINTEHYININNQVNHNTYFNEYNYLPDKKFTNSLNIPFTQSFNKSKVQISINKNVSFYNNMNETVKESNQFAVYYEDKNENSRGVSENSINEKQNDKNTLSTNNVQNEESKDKRKNSNKISHSNVFPIKDSTTSLGSPEIYESNQDNTSIDDYNGVQKHSDFIELDKENSNTEDTVFPLLERFKIVRNSSEAASQLSNFNISQTNFVEVDDILTNDEEKLKNVNNSSVGDVIRIYDYITKKNKSHNEGDNDLSIISLKNVSWKDKPSKWTQIFNKNNLEEEKNEAITSNQRSYKNYDKGKNYFLTIDKILPIYDVSCRSNKDNALIKSWDKTSEINKNPTTTLPNAYNNNDNIKSQTSTSHNIWVHSNTKNVTSENNLDSNKIHEVSVIGIDKNEKVENTIDKEHLNIQKEHIHFAKDTEDLDDRNTGKIRVIPMNNKAKDESEPRTNYLFSYKHFGNPSLEEKLTHNKLNLSDVVNKLEDDTSEEESNNVDATGMSIHEFPIDYYKEQRNIKNIFKSVLGFLAQMFHVVWAGVQNGIAALMDNSAETEDNK